MAHYGRVSVVLVDHPTSPAAAEYDHHPDTARAQADEWTQRPEAAASIVASTWEFVLPDGSMHVIMWHRGHPAAEFRLPALPAL